MNFKDFMPVYKEKPARIYKYKFTVFTPVFNCEKSILKVHESLLNQTFKDFEWVVINDGSTDNSNEVLTKIVKDSPLTINYVNNTVNKHKMSCFIQAIEIAQGELLLPFDGDDECFPEALEIFNKEYEDIPENLKPKVAAVTAHCKDQYGNLVGELFPEDPFFCYTVEAEMTKKIIGEKWGFTKTDVLKDIDIKPEMLTLGFIPENVIWNTVARNGFLTKCINKTLRLYNIGVEGSIMNTPMTSKSAVGTILNCVAECNWFFNKYFFKAPILFLKRAYIILRSSTYLEYPLKVYLKSIDPLFIKFLLLILWPFRRLLK